MRLTSRLPGFHRLDLAHRRQWLLKGEAKAEDLEALEPGRALGLETADKMVENAVGVISLPLGIGLNFQINGRDHLVPMAVEEPSVVASASHAARIVRQSGGFQTEATNREMIGQVEVRTCVNPATAKVSLLRHEAEILAVADSVHPTMRARGGGARAISVHPLPDGLVVHLIVDTCDAMGANTVNTMVEAIAPLISDLTGGRVGLRILSNYTDSCLARARCVIAPAHLTAPGFSGPEVRDGIVQATLFAGADFHRAVTHNKGVMNGVDAVVIATGNDWRAIEAAAHGHACRTGRYRPLTTWDVDLDGNLVGSLELPMPVGSVGGSVGLTPGTRAALRLCGVEGAQELAQLIVAVGLAQNLGALKALATHGIQHGHMALHARSVALAAGAQGELVERVAQEIVRLGEVRVSAAREILARLT